MSAPSSGERLARGALALWAALLWAWLIERLNQLWLPGYVPPALGPTLGTLPLLWVGAWALWWALLARVAARPARLVGALGTIGALVGWGAGWLALLMGPAAVAGWWLAGRLLASIAPAGTGHWRLRFLLTTLLLSVLALAYALWLGLLAGVTA